MIDIGSGNGSGGKGSAPTPTPILNEMDSAGLALEMMQMIPKAELLPILFVSLKMEHDMLRQDFDRLLNFMKDKGLDYDR